MYFESYSALIGNTPLFRLRRLEEVCNLKARLSCKLEMFNPSGSAKDRAALFMLISAEKEGKITKTTAIIEPTSGNTGIALAALCAARGYSLTLTMPENMSEERRKLLCAYGACIVLTPAKLGMQGAIDKADELAGENKDSFIPSQFTNAENAAAHYKTTGPEIWQDTKGDICAFVAGVGTGGTITGAGRYLKEQNPCVQIVAVEPEDSSVLSGNPPAPHQIQGIGAGFIPAVLDRSLLDTIIPVEFSHACRCARLLAQNEGILAGISSGAALHAALTLAQDDSYKDKHIVVLLPDTGERYLSTSLFS